MILSILTNYFPDLGDFFLLVISILLGLVTFYSKQQVNKIEKFMRENMTDHMNMEKRLVDMDARARAIHKTQIEPTFLKSNENEKKIIEVRYEVRNNEKRIIKLESDEND